MEQSIKASFIIPDAHGNVDLVASLLQQEGILNEDWDRMDRQTHTIQLGDLLNCVDSTVVDDNRCLDHAEDWFDIYLVGNHEHPYFGGPRFAGFWHDLVLKQRLLSLKSRGVIQAAHEVDGILLTHAGLIAGSDIAGESGTAAQWAEGLNDVWRRDPKHGFFSAIGRSRGGDSRFGGVLWADWREPKHAAFPQIFGHTVGLTWRAIGPMNEEPSFTLIRPYADATPMQAAALCLDCGAGKGATRILGAWIRGGEVEIVEHISER